MAIGDDALAAGMPILTGTEPANTLDTEVNRTRDIIAQRTSAVTPVNKGGTGSTTAAGARTNIGAAAASHTHDDRYYTESQTDSLLDAKLTKTSGQYNSDFAARDSAISSKAALADLQYVQQGNMHPDIYGRDITTTPRSLWISSGGQMGYASSRREKKQNFEAPDWTPGQLMQVPILHYRYRAAVARERLGEGRAATELGTIANDLHALGLWEFVIYEGRGEDAIPQGVHYELLGLAALWLAQRAYELAADNAARLDALEGEHDASPAE